MTEMIEIEAITDKFKNKFSNGSVLVGGVWLQVAPSVPLNTFEKGGRYAVDTKTNAKGYKSITGLTESVTKTEVTPKTVTETIGEAKTVVKNTYNEDKNRRILVQGITQAAVQAPSLAGLPFTTVADVAKNTIELSKLLIAFVESES